MRQPGARLGGALSWAAAAPVAGGRAIFAFIDVGQPHPRNPGGRCGDGQEHTAPLAQDSACRNGDQAEQGAEGMSAVEQLIKTAVAFAAMLAVDRGMKPLLLLALLSLSYPQSSHSSVILRAFSEAETSQLKTTGSGTTGWVGNTLTLSRTSVHSFTQSWLDPDDEIDFIPSDAIGIHFEVSTNVRLNGVDVIIAKYARDPYGSFLADSAHNVSGFSILDWFASIAGPGIAQRIDDIPQTTISDVTNVDFFFASETLAVDSQSNPNVWDSILFTSGGPEDGQSPGSIVYANVSWILTGSTGNTRSKPDNQMPEPTTLALVGAALLGAAATRRRKPTTPTC